jgi:GH25 family lysozyme M1 (1,4-beta-N-acetylmuramidase)
MTITFADTSHYQTVNLAAYKAAGYDRLVMKATGGADDGTLRYADSTFPARWREARRVGLARVAYHFARNNNSGGSEFAWCRSQLQAAGGLGPNDVLCYDSEDDRSSAMIGLAAQRTREFTAAAVAAGITYGWIYSGAWYLGPAGITAAMLPPGWRHLWISDYTAGMPDSRIEVPPGWSRSQLVARQYTDSARIPGISTCDANRVIREWLPREGDLPSLDEVRAVVRAELDAAASRRYDQGGATGREELKAIPELLAAVRTLQASIDQLVALQTPTPVPDDD